MFKSRLKQCFRKVENLQILVRPGPGGGQPRAVFFTLVTSKTLFFTLRPGRRGGQTVHARPSGHTLRPGRGGGNKDAEPEEGAMRLSRFRRHTAVHQSLTTAFDAFTNSQNEMCLATSTESMHLNLI